MNSINHVYKSQADLNKAVELWQKRLLLRDWAIEASLVRASDFGDFDQMGLCEFYFQTCKAVISILDPIDYHPSFHHPYDAEWILVHEMLHVVLARLSNGMPEGSAPEDDLEVTINKLTEALVRAYRK
jgi:hypothetical protein